MSCFVRCLTLLVLSAAALAAQNLKALGVKAPPSADVPYLIHVTNLVELPRGEAVEESSEKEQKYWVAGTSSPVSTPLASPEFLYRTEQVGADAIRLYRFEVVKGRREILIRKKKKVVAEALPITVFPVEGAVYRLRVNTGLSKGEYCLTPDGSDAVFCFAVY